MDVKVVAIKKGQVKGYNRSVFVRNYGSSGAIDVYTDDVTVTVTYRNGDVKEYDKNRGILIRSY